MCAEASPRNITCSWTGPQVLSIEKLWGGVGRDTCFVGGQSRKPRLRSFSFLIGCGGHITEAEWTLHPEFSLLLRLMMLHVCREDMKSLITHIMSLSGESKTDSRAGLKMA